MNLLNNCTTNEIRLLEKAGINIEDREYTKEELRKCELSIEEFIMNHSTKNGNIDTLCNQYHSVLNTLIKGE